jgi:hypothetical protein
MKGVYEEMKNTFEGVADAGQVRCGGVRQVIKERYKFQTKWFNLQDPADDVPEFMYLVRAPHLPSDQQMRKVFNFARGIHSKMIHAYPDSDIKDVRYYCTKTLIEDFGHYTDMKEYTKAIDDFVNVNMNKKRLKDGQCAVPASIGKVDLNKLSQEPVEEEKEEEVDLTPEQRELLNLPAGDDKQDEKDQEECEDVDSEMGDNFGGYNTQDENSDDDDAITNPAEVSPETSKASQVSPKTIRVTHETSHTDGTEDDDEDLFPASKKRRCDDFHPEMDLEEKNQYSPEKANERVWGKLGAPKPNAEKETCTDMKQQLEACPLPKFKTDPDSIDNVKPKKTKKPKIPGLGKLNEEMLRSSDLEDLLKLHAKVSRKGMYLTDLTDEIFRRICRIHDGKEDGGLFEMLRYTEEVYRMAGRQSELIFVIRGVQDGGWIANFKRYLAFA